MSTCRMCMKDITGLPFYSKKVNMANKPLCASCFREVEHNTSNLTSIDLGHTVGRVAIRVDKVYVPQVARAIQGIQDKWCAKRRLPNDYWFRTLRDGVGPLHKQTVICHICGYGNWIRTVLAADMTPKGVEI